MDPMRRCLRPQTEFVYSDARLDGFSSMGTVDGRDTAKNEPIFQRWLEAELRHGINEALEAGSCHATGAL